MLQADRLRKDLEIARQENYQNDLNKHHPEKVRELQLALEKWRNTIGAVMPIRAGE